MCTKSMTDVAYEVMSNKKRAVAFDKLWQEVSKRTGKTIDYMAEFYTDLSLDGRFVSLKDNKWDLKNHRKYEETHVDLSKIELDDDKMETVYDEDGNIIEEPEDELY